MDSASIPNNRKSKINYNMQPISNGFIKYNRLNKLYSMANGPKEKWIEMRTQRDREVRERERIMCPYSAHA